MRKISFVLWSVLLVACHRMPDNSVVVHDFPVVINLKGDSIVNFDNELGINGMQDAGDFILCSSHRTEYNFSVYEKRSRHKVGNFLKRGRGAGEFLAPRYCMQYKIEGGETKIWVLERALNKFFKINLSRSILNDSLFVEREYDISNYKSASYRDMFYINEDLLLAIEDEMDCKCVYLSLAKNERKVVSPVLAFPKVPHVHEISQTISVKHPENFCCASVFFNFPQINLIDSVGVYRTIFYKELIYPRETTVTQREKEYFCDVCCDTKRVYVLYNPSEETMPDFSEVLVFTWEGEPICKYLIPFATSIFVDERNQVLYALNTQKETFNTSVYALS